jgi:hypothetical protein
MTNAAYYGTSSTSASTAAKVVTCANFQTLETNAVVTVRFTSSNTSTGSLTLNVNSTGAKSIYVGGAVVSGTNLLLWGSGAIITFVYDGTNWRVAGEPRCWYGTSSTSAGTAGKVSTIDGVVVCKGTRVTIGMSYANTSTTPTLNLSSTVARNIYYGTGTDAPTADSGYSWAAGDTVDLVFDGEYWRLADTTALTKIKG